MGAGILPTAIYNNKLYFLFGKENRFADTPGFSDFGGGTDNQESFMETAIREGTEEMTGFLGSKEELERMINKRGTYDITFNTYRMHILPMKYDLHLQHYYNNNVKFIHKTLDPQVIKKSKIFEKEEIKWICIDDLMKHIKDFRSYFQEVVPMIYSERNAIYNFIKKSGERKGKGKGKTKKTRSRGKKTNSKHNTKNNRIN